VPDKRCSNGHFIDESWDLCPYCPPAQGKSSPEIVRPRAVRELKAAPDPPPLRSREIPSPAPSSSSEVPMQRTVAVQKMDPALLAAPHRYVVGWLVGLNGLARGESYQVRSGRNILGRDRKSDIMVNDDQTSAHHADLVYRPEEHRFILMDSNSTNGTYVNEVEIEPRRDLTAGDILRIGSHRYLFVPLCNEQLFWDGGGPLK
jgi:hypothetical protein